MNSLALIAAALVLAAPGSRATVVTAPGEAHEAHARAMIGKFGPARPESEAMRQFRDSFRPQIQRQVHIEQRMIIRITPSSTIAPKMITPMSIQTPIAGSCR